MTLVEAAKTLGIKENEMTYGQELRQARQRLIDLRDATPHQGEVRAHIVAAIADLSRAIRAYDVGQR